MKTIAMCVILAAGLLTSVFAGPSRHDQNPLVGQVGPHSVGSRELLVPWNGFVIDEPRIKFQGYSGYRSYGRAICVGMLVSASTGREEWKDSPDMNATVYATRIFRLYTPHHNVTMWNNNPESMGGWRWERRTIREFYICYTDRGIVALPEMPQKGMVVRKWQ